MNTATDVSSSKGDKNRRTNQNLSKDESARLRAIAAYHGYRAITGPHAGQGNGFALTLAILQGEVATVQVDRAHIDPLVRFLAEQAQLLTSTDPHLADAVQRVAEQLAFVTSPALVSPLPDELTQASASA